MQSKIAETFPFRVISPNVKEHWTKPYKRKAAHELILVQWWKKLEEKPAPPCTVSIIRICRRFYDDDNLIAGCKPLRDLISDLIRPGFAPGHADGKNSGITWKYLQEKGYPESVRIEITK